MPEITDRERATAILSRLAAFHLPPAVLPPELLEVLDWISWTGSAVLGDKVAKDPAIVGKVLDEIAGVIDLHIIARTSMLPSKAVH